jgi:hypothetical protein
MFHFGKGRQAKNHKYKYTTIICKNQGKKEGITVKIRENEVHKIFTTNYTNCTKSNAECYNVEKPSESLAGNSGGQQK